MLFLGKSIIHTKAIAEDNNNFYIWTNDRFSRDIIIVNKAFENCDKFEMVQDGNLKRNMLVDHIEVKDLRNNGAQLSMNKLDISTDGQFKIKVKDDIKEIINDNIKSQIEKYDILKDSYGTYKLNLSEDEELDYFLNDYYRLHTRKISIRTKDDSIIDIPVFKDDKENNWKIAKQMLKDNGIKIHVNIRTMKKQSLTKKDKQNFLKNYGCMFKSGIAKEEFTIDDLKTNSDDNFNCDIRLANKLDGYYQSNSGKYQKLFIKIGNYVYKIQKDKYDSNTNLKKQKFHLNDFIVYEPNLMGQIEFTN